jgi:hypothetical protein
MRIAPQPKRNGNRRHRQNMLIVLLMLSLVYPFATQNAAIVHADEIGDQVDEASGQAAAGHGAEDPATVDLTSSNRWAGGPWVAEPIAVQLPPAPAAIAGWIDAGSVTIDFYDPQRERFAFAAETRFDFRFTYRCQTQWRLLGNATVGEATLEKPAARRGPKPWSERTRSRKKVESEPTPVVDQPSQLEVRLAYELIDLSVSHRMRLPESVVNTAVFDHPLVRHEFDHVAISADPGLRSRLAAMLKRRNSVIIEQLDAWPGRLAAPPSDTAEVDQSNKLPKPPILDEPEEQLGQQRRRYEAIANSIASRETKRVFADFIESVAIRYRELDRVTLHGTEPLSDEERVRLIGAASPE